MVLIVMEQTIQCCIVGDGMVGKSSIIKSFIEQSTPGDYVATISDSYSGDASFIGVNYTVSISDCTGEVSIIKIMSTLVIFSVCIFLLQASLTFIFL